MNDAIAANEIRHGVVEAQGMTLPKLGFGTWKLEGDDACDAVAHAVRTGYRHIDTAQIYGNEMEVGAGLARGLRETGLRREDVFLTTKVWMDRVARDKLSASVEASLERLKTDYVDLLLLHWPVEDTPLAEQIGALQSVRRRGLARHVGLSNYTTQLLGEAAAVSDGPLAANQVEYHPFLDQAPVLTACRARDMAVIAYSPIAQGRVFDEPALAEIAKTHGLNPGQLALKWLIQQDGVAAIPRSSKREHITANFELGAAPLSADEIQRINALRSDTGRLIDPSWAPAWDRAG